MRKKILAGILSLSLVFANIAFPITGNENTSDSVSAAETDKWSLVWSDEFEGTSLNRNYWNVEVNGYGGWNNELQYYCDSPENIQVSDGTLKLIAQKKQYEGKEYTSARINTQNKVTVHHGRIEAKMKLPKFMGAFPAFWMMGANGKQWPACGEIDIMEIVNDESIVYGTAHWQASYANNEDKYDSNGSSTYEAGVKVDITEWHTYGIEWTENKITWFVDDNYYHSIDITSEKEMEELSIPCYFLLNFAIGGDWPGFNIDNSALPATVEVDYVRAYEVNDNYVEPPTIVVEEDIVASHTGTWTTNVGTWGSGSGNMTSTQVPSEGFNANLTAIGTDMWAIYARLDDLKYTAGNTYTFKSTFTSNIDKNVFVKVEGDNQAALAESYVALKAGVPYTYETTVFIPNTYTGALSLYYAVGGVMNGESLASTTAANISVKDVSFSAKTTMIDPGYSEETTMEETTVEETTTEAPTTTTTKPPVEEDTTVIEGSTKVDLIENYTGSWDYIIGEWAAAAGTFTSTQTPADGFVANLTAVGNNEWGAQASLSNLAYTPGTDYTYRCVLTSNIDKNVFIKVQGDNNAEVVPAEYVYLKAGVPYQYEKTVSIPSDYTGSLALFFAYGGGANAETIDATTAANISVSDVEFYTYVSGSGEEVTEAETDEITTEPTIEQPVVPFGVEINGLENSFTIVMGNPLNGQTYNLYVDGVYVSNLTLGFHTITNIPAGTHTIKLTGVLNGVESEGYETQINVLGAVETEEPTTEELIEVPGVEPELSIYGYQISTTVEGFRTIYSVDDPANKVVSSGLIYGLYDISDSEMVIGSSNDTVYHFESTSAGKINYELEGLVGNGYSMTMRFIKSAAFYNAKLNVRAYAKLKDGSYIYSDVSSLTIYDLADDLYQNKQMNTNDAHDYLYDNILYFVNKSYESVEFDSNNTLYK